MAQHPLVNAPARISDLSLPERKEAMLQRDAERRASWLEARERRGFLARLMDRARG